MHLCIAASLDPLCWAIACQAKAATENPNAAAKKSLFALLMVHLPAAARVHKAPGLNAVCPSRPRTPAIRVSPDKWMRFFLISFSAEIQCGFTVVPPPRPERG